MKTPDEVKMGLECCIVDDCTDCPYEENCFSDNEELCQTMTADAFAYIRQLERERDAAVKTIKEYGDCKHCKHNSLCTDRFPCCTDCIKTNCPCHTCAYRSNWKWRGVQEVE